MMSVVTVEKTITRVKLLHLPALALCAGIEGFINDYISEHFDDGDTTILNVQITELNEHNIAVITYKENTLSIVDT